MEVSSDSANPSGSRLMGSIVRPTVVMGIGWSAPTTATGSSPLGRRHGLEPNPSSGLWNIMVRFGVSTIKVD